MRTSDFNFDLPSELIAQTPAERRDRSRLLCMDKVTGGIAHRRFFELPGLLRRGDCLVLNDSRVIPARLMGRRETGGAAEVVLLRDRGDGAWECLTRPGRKTKPGAALTFGSGELSAVVTDELSEGVRILEFSCGGAFMETLERLGKMPLPPYIRENLQDAERYQTVYSRAVGSAAAPTAGLHFTDELLGEIAARGVSVCYLTLHVGLGTFRPVKSELVEAHKMHSEFFSIPDGTAAAVNRAKSEGGRVIAVGTTSCRTLESCADSAGRVSPVSGSTDIFIYPGYRFLCVDGLITNFHLPESTLIMLASAFAGRDNVLRAYDEAIKERYRFYSFGDACFFF